MGWETFAHAPPVATRCPPLLRNICVSLLRRLHSARVTLLSCSRASSVEESLSTTTVRNRWWMGGTRTVCYGLALFNNGLFGSSSYPHPSDLAEHLFAQGSLLFALARPMKAHTFETLTSFTRQGQHTHPPAGTDLSRATMINNE